MIRRDYIVRMIEEFVQLLAGIRDHKQAGQWEQAARTLDEEFHRLIGVGARDSMELSDMDLLARLVEGVPTLVVRDKTLMLTALLKEAGDVATAQGRAAEGRAYRLKGLELLLTTLARDEPHECPAFVPKVEAFVAALQDSALPVRTLVLLMHHYESVGEFGKAEDMLFAMIESKPADPSVLEFGLAFYERLLGQSEAALNAGNLPRVEVEAGMAELHERGKRQLKLG